MATRVCFTNDPERALEQGRSFLVSRSLLHNLLLTILEARVTSFLPGRYWLAMDSDRVVGVVLQSPLHYSPNISPMPPEAVDAMTRAISEAGIELPGVNGEVSAASRFAGSWMECSRSAAVPFQGQRLYASGDSCPESEAPGRLRRAAEKDHDLVGSWVRKFYDEIGEEFTYQDKFVKAGIDGGRFWLWECGNEPVCMVGTEAPAAGVVRLRLQFTPGRLRNSGFAQACVGAVTRRMHAAGFRCAGFTDLGNPVSNAVVRRMGWRAVAEWLRYRFILPGQSSGRPPTDRDGHSVRSGIRPRRQTGRPVGERGSPRQTA